MSNTLVYHNPRCSKSRELVKLFEEKGIEFSPVLYMEKGLTAEELRDVLGKLGMSARDLLRTSEAAYKEQQLADPALDEEALIAAMVAEPKLMQRPIVVHGTRAVVARPAALGLDIL